ncbi:MAG: CRISPR-associated endonuclease Cas1 [Candidatus Aquicultor secundus]|uniref:CRISPR-associated endonuclease Cas1 n=1 Tax=Candidatus Aquicultor secundus TaxID=1973895 RepID=A0A2M7T7Z0_9ACTN|nr:CRISPR-associated endonuclease Cas1 [Candidatus Aquicultor secundus]NCO66651.1 CRISPR-associated endonuclease Cas1 [Solirubrobacter sp.]OIO85832.1 MAG: CRISPR-associated endonuclease Cas1 [Candidatus Aquicultor secundus]PIU26098.1 MAG: CRISPR-associated endonuclease Cas1 [Candidatus Aquicultor secundus]PIW22534.1 MAG: CRISPR-associated endonuclease Cas1 [Candidatus Aquicultor secundus]PIX51790.1 MAG: CRISPR-associated endonuclease Cas1 [Candidatus Aquicultor secundus]
MDIIVSEFGYFLGKKSERLVIKENGKIKEEVPFFKINQVLITSNGVSLSSDVIKECAVAGIPLTFLSSDGKPYAIIQSPHLQGTVITRREQMVAYNDHRGFELAKQFARGKISNQVNLLKYASKYRKTADPEAYELLRTNVSKIEDIKKSLDGLIVECIDEGRESILNLEGRSASIYWSSVARIIPATYSFTSREKRGATDIVNSLLNYGYGILYSQIAMAIALAGLDPYAGFLHVDRSGKPSLVLDLIEEFRQPVVDKTILGMLGRNADWRVVDGKLDDKTRRDLAERIMERLEARETYERKKFTLRTIIQRQARAVAAYVRREKPYKPFLAGW